MKTLLFSIFCSTTLCSANTAKLEFAYDFNTAPGSSDLSAFNSVTGTEDMTHVGGGWVGYDTGYGESGYAHKMVQNGGTFQRTMDMSFSEGFTLSANIKHAATGSSQNDWNNIFTMQIGTHNLQFQKNATGSNVFSIYGAGVSGDFTLTPDTWYTFTLVGGMSEINSPTLTFNIYGTSTAPDGSYSPETALVKSIDLTATDYTADSMITSMTFGNAGGGNSLDSASYFYDNFSGYSGHLSIEQQMELVSNMQANKITTQFIPEPATATMSLLALAGLCMRRRRK